MTLDSLRPDQRAVLQLILQQGRGYEEIASLLRIGVDAVRGRATAALESLGPADDLTGPEERAEIADYLLGQQNFSQRGATRRHLATAAGARAWARVVAAELEPLAREPLPEIPDEELPEPEPAPVGRPRTVRIGGLDDVDRGPVAPAGPLLSTGDVARRPSSRLGGALLLAGLAIVVAVAVILLVNGGGDDDGGPTGGGRTQATQTPNTPTVTAQINLRPPQAGSKALGIAQILRQGQQRALTMVAQDLPQSTRKRGTYAVWLANSPGRGLFLGFTPIVGADGKLSVAPVALPARAGSYREILVTLERHDNPRRPGRVVLRGPLNLG